MKPSVEITTLFVYGTLLDAGVRIRLLARDVETARARLVGYARGKKRYFFVTERKGAATEGAILLRLTQDDLRKLDEYEVVPALYTREKVRVLSDEGIEIECWTYLPTDWAD